MRIEDWDDRTLAAFGRAMVHDNGPEARAVRAEMLRRIEAAEAAQPPIKVTVIDYGPTRSE